MQVLVKGKRIADLLPESATVEGARVLDCQGKLLLPGLIDVHWHTMLAAIPQMTAMTADLGYLYLVAAKEAQRTLMRGFTSVRDAGGPAFALARAIDEGLVDGPRIYPSGAMISQTSGHGDFRLRSDLPRADNAPLSLVENTGVAMIADGEAQVLRRVREQLMLGASQIKMLAGGGVASLYDPLDSTQFTERELRAGVEAASDWNTYVMTRLHAQGHPARDPCRREVHRARSAGRRGQRAPDARPGRVVEPAAVPAGRGQQRLSRRGAAGQPEAGGRGHGPGLCAGAEARRQDGLGHGYPVQPRNTATQGRQLAKLTRFYDPLTLLGQATGVNGELLALSGERNPYPGALGRIAPGAWADLLVADGDPSANLDFLADPDKNLRLIMKDGKVHKNTL